MILRTLVMPALLATALLASGARADTNADGDRARGWWLVEGGPGWAWSEDVDGPEVSVRALRRMSRRVHFRLGATSMNAHGDGASDPTERTPAFSRLSQVSLEPGAEIELNPGRRVIATVVGTLPIVHGRASDAEEWEVVREISVGLRVGAGVRVPLGRRMTLRPELSVLHRQVGVPVFTAPLPDAGRGERRWTTDWDLGVTLGWRF